MTDKSSSPEVPQCAPGRTSQWYSAMGRHAAAIARLYSQGTPVVPNTPDVYEEEEAALRDLMLMPAPSFDLLLTKFGLYRELFSLCDEIFVDRRELVFFAAIEADVRRLAVELKQQ